MNALPSILSLLLTVLLCVMDHLDAATNPTSTLAESEEASSEAIPSSPNQTLPIPTEAHRLALLSAEAFAHEGFRIRDEEWASTLVPGTPLFLTLTLFSGNHYRFVMASSTPSAKISMMLYDASGLPVSCELQKNSEVQSGFVGTAGITPAISGIYFLGLQLLESPSGVPVDFSLLSAYK